MEDELMQQEEVMEQDAPEVEVDPWEDSWDDIMTDDLVDDDTDTEADEPEEEEEEVEEGAATDEPEEQPEEPVVQKYKLTHLGKEQEVTLEDMIALAQKGMDYDHTKSKVTELTATNSNYEAFLKKLAESNGKSLEDFMDITEARMLMADEAKSGNKLTETDAILRIKNGKTKKEEEPAQKQTDPEAMKHDMLMRFIAAYPDVKGDDIPADVWNDGFKTGDLAGAYSRYENRQLRKKIETLEQNQKNRARSTGSRKTAGAAKGKDAFDALWYDGT